MKKIYLISFLLFLNIACKNNKKQVQSINQKNTTKLVQKKFDNIMKLNKVEAINEYGVPVSNNSFTLDNAFGEFRNGINNVFQDIKDKKEIKIDEITWEKNTTTYITVWYHKSMPKYYYVWEKGTEF